MASLLRKARAGRIAQVAALLLACCSRPALAAPVQFDISRQRADTALTEFARQAGIPVLFPYDLVSGRTARAVHGRYEPEDALQILLRGTGLEARSDAQGQISVRVQPRAPVTGLVNSLAVLDSDERAGAPQRETIGEITVTGSRIERDGMMTPTPVTAIYGAELQAMGPGALVDALVQLPQFLNNDTPQSQAFASSGAAGSSYMNLRGIGSSRTLTLLDGRRVVPTTRTGSFDVALLPRNLLQRIEVVTGGASAAYGSDAVTGVVNMLLDTRADGIKVRAQGGITELGDAANYELAMSYGAPIGERSHLLLAGEFNRIDGVRGYDDRDWFGSWAAIASPDAADPDRTGPARYIVRDARATGYTYGGLITGGPLAGTQFLAGGVPAPFVAGGHVTAVSQAGGSGVDPGRDLVWIQPDQTRGNAYLKYETTWDGGSSAFLQGLYAYSGNSYEKDPSSQWGSWEATIFADNAFLPQSIRTAMQSAGIDSFRFGRVSTDLGATEVENRSNMLMGTAGFKTPLGGGWQLQGYYQFGSNDAELHYVDAVRVDRVYRAFDTVLDPRTGAAICRSTLSFPDDGCVPADPFGPGSISSAARAWITAGSSEQDQRLTQQVVEMKAQGTPLTLPAGDLSLAVGATWRRESLDNQTHRMPAELEGLGILPDEQQGYRGLPDSYVGLPNIFERTVFSTVNGRYTVWELFAEGEWPLLRSQAGPRRLDLNTAVRFANYSGSGGVPAWKVGLDWRMSSQVRLRATRSRDIRAGSLSERFDSSGVGSVIADPLMPTSGSYGIIAVRSGNPAIDPEKSDTLTFGGVWQPEFVRGFAMSADYYDIRVDDAIGNLGAQMIIDRCYAGEASMCGFIQRNSITGLITAVNNGFLNIAEARSRGIDTELSLRRRISLFGGEEGLALRIFANYALDISMTSPGGATVDRAGQTGLPGGGPRWQANLTLAYERGPLQLTVQERVISAGTYSALFGARDIDDNHVAGAAYTNLRLSWRWGQDPQSLLLFANVSNLFDRDPPLAPDWGFVGSVHTNEGLFDVLGRRYTLGLRLRR